MERNNNLLGSLSVKLFYYLPTKPFVENTQTVCFGIMLSILSQDTSCGSNTSILQILLSKWH